MKNKQIIENTYWRDLLTKVALILATVALIVWAMPRDSSTNFKVEKGKPWRYADFTAPFDFPIYKSEEWVKHERDSLIKEFEPYYNYDNLVEAKLVKQFRQDYADGIPGVPDEHLQLIIQYLHIFYSQGIMNSSEYNELHADTSKVIRVVLGKNAVSTPVTKIFSTVGAYERLFLDTRLAEYKSVLVKCSLNDYIMANLSYDKERSETGLADLMSSIPLASGVAQQGQKIIDRGDIVDERTYNILESFFRESERRQKDDAKLSYIIL